MYGSDDSPPRFREALEDFNHLERRVAVVAVVVWREGGFGGKTKKTMGLGFAGKSKGGR